MRIQLSGHPLRVFLYLSSAIVLNTMCVIGQTERPTTAANDTLASVLNPDGTVKRGTVGSFDPKGFRMITGKSGKPQFAPVGSDPATCNDLWDDRFPVNGFNSRVMAIAIDSAGNLYAGGFFTIVGGVRVNHIAKWDGTSWSPLGSGVGGVSNSRVNAIAVSGADLYVGGRFATAGGLTVNHIAKWDGTSWSALGSGLTGTSAPEVNSLGVRGGDLLVGGRFTSAGGETANYVARWSGSSWSPLGQGTNNIVRDLAIAPDGTVFFGGDFTTAGGSSANRIAKWDGTSWSSLGTGLDASVYGIAVSGNDVYVAGEFLNAGGSTARRVAKWDGTAWSRMGSNSAFPAGMTEIEIIDGTLFVGGGSLHYWNGSSWIQVLNPNTGGAFQKFLAHGGSFYAAGNLLTLDGVRGLGKWNGANFERIDANYRAGLTTRPDALAASGNTIYVGGGFDRIGAIAANNIARWDGTSWFPLGSGTNGQVRDIAISGNDVYVVGDFTTAGGVPAANIARWNGTSWFAVGSLNVSVPYNCCGMPSALVSAVALAGNDVFVGGGFLADTRNIKKWNGSAWGPVGSRTQDGEIFDIAVEGSNVYVASFNLGSTGNFPPQFFPTYKIQKFDGTAWTEINTMWLDSLSKIAVHGGELYAVFETQSEARLAKWNGAAWINLGPSLGNREFLSMAFSGSDIYVAGGGDIGDGSNLAKLSSGAFVGLGEGTDLAIHDVAATDDSLYIAGDFSLAGCTPSGYFGRYFRTRWFGLLTPNWHDENNWSIEAVPAPDSSMIIPSGNPVISAADVTVKDLVIKDGASLTVGAGRTLTVTGSLNLDGGSVKGPGIVNVTNCDSAAVTGGGTSAFVSAPLKRCVNAAGSYRFPVGGGQTYSPVELSDVQGSGNLTVEAFSGAFAGPASGLPLNRLQRWWSMTNVGITRADVRFAYSNSDVIGPEESYRAYAIVAGTATLFPTEMNLTSNTASVDNVSAFEKWTLAAASADPGTITGRITTASGRGAGKVTVTLMDGAGNMRYATTNPFGVYRFVSVSPYQNYTLGVSSKRFSFAEALRAIAFTEGVANVDIVSDDH